MVWDKAKNFGVVQWKKRRSNEMLFVRIVHKKLDGKKALLSLNPLTRNKFRKIKTIISIKFTFTFYFIYEEGEVSNFKSKFQVLHTFNWVGSVLCRYRNSHNYDKAAKVQN